MLRAHHLKWVLTGTSSYCHLECWGFRSFELLQMSCMEPFAVFFICLRFNSPKILQLFRRMLQRCFAVKLQKCFVSYETSPHFEGEEMMTGFYFLGDLLL